MAGRPGPPKDLPLGVALETGSADGRNPQPGHPGHPGPRGGKNKLTRQREFLVVWGEIGRLAAPPASTWEGRGQSLRCLPRLLAALGVDFAFANPTLHREPNRWQGPVSHEVDHSRSATGVAVPACCATEGRASGSRNLR